MILPLCEFNFNETSQLQSFMKIAPSQKFLNLQYLASGFQAGPTFQICSSFFMKMPYHPYFFNLKSTLHLKIQNLFLACSNFMLTNVFFFSESTLQNISIFNFCPQRLNSACNKNRELSGRLLDSRPSGRGFKPHRRCCIVSLSRTHLS